MFPPERIRVAIGPVAATLLAVALQARAAARGAAEPAIRGLDHVVIAVTDLEAAARAYRALGFSLKPGRPHANGIANRHVKFTNGTEIELITAPAGSDSLTSEYRRHLARGDGAAFLALYAPLLGDVAARLDGDAPARMRLESGVLVFPPGHRLRHFFFGGRNHSPTDRPEHFAHANGATTLLSVWLAGDDLAPERELLARLGAGARPDTVHVPDACAAEAVSLPEGEVVLLPGSRQLVPGRRIVGATLGVRSLERAAAALSRDIPVISRGRSLFLGPTAAHGIWIELREAP